MLLDPAPRHARVEGVDVTRELLDEGRALERRLLRQRERRARVLHDDRVLRDARVRRHDLVRALEPRPDALDHLLLGHARGVQLRDDHHAQEVALRAEADGHLDVRVLLDGLLERHRVGLLAVDQHDGVVLAADVLPLLGICRVRPEQVLGVVAAVRPRREELALEARLDDEVVDAAAFVLELHERLGVRQRHEPIPLVPRPHHQPARLRRPVRVAQRHARRDQPVAQLVRARRPAELHQVERLHLVDGARHVGHQLERVRHRQQARALGRLQRREHLLPGDGQARAYDCHPPAEDDRAHQGEDAEPVVERRRDEGVVELLVQVLVVEEGQPPMPPCGYRLGEPA